MNLMLMYPRALPRVWVSPRPMAASRRGWKIAGRDYRDYEESEARRDIQSRVHIYVLIHNVYVNNRENMYFSLGSKDSGCRGTPAGVNGTSRGQTGVFLGGHAAGSGGERSLYRRSRPRGGVRLQSRALIDQGKISYIAYMYVSIHLYNICDVYRYIQMYIILNKNVCIYLYICNYLGSSPRVVRNLLFYELRTSRRPA